MKNELRNKYDTFIYNSFNIVDNGLELVITYNYKISEFEFNPMVTIDKKIITNKSVDKIFLNDLLFNFGMINAINYYKLTCAKKIIVNAGYLNEEQKEFFKKLFYKGLGEFLYVNQLNINYDNFVSIETIDGENRKYDIEGNYIGNLIPIGGGKDSIVTLELLKDCKDINKCFLFNRNIYPTNQAAIYTIKYAGYKEKDITEFNLTLDPLMLELNKKEFLNGHIPFSSTLAFASYIMAYLTNKKYIVLSNEASANEKNVKDSDINHQYSKSYEFEKDFRQYTEKYFCNKIEYFSLLRCWNEYEIVKEFVKNPKYLDIFRSCNRGTKTNSWCADCSKCLYVFIMLYPFIGEDRLASIFGFNMLDDEKYKDILLGLVSDNYDKPFECVGTKEEINYALENIIKENSKLPILVQYYKDNIYNENKVYNIETYFNKENFIPEEYKDRMIIHSMKQDIIDYLNNKKILILGYGREGKSAYKFIKDNVAYKEIAIADQNVIEVEDDIKTYFGDDYLNSTKEYDIVIKSPGIIIKNYISEEEKIKITSLTDLFIKFCKNKIIGITGTKGKSTTSSLIYHILKENNYDTYLIGNIGVPCFDVIDKIKENTILVYELSCHQLEYISKSPYIGILLNIYEEHLDHYNSINDYVNCKKNIYKYQTNDNYLIYGDIFNYVDKSEFEKTSTNRINLYGNLIPFDEIETSLVGEHNKYNIIIALLATKIIGVSKRNALKAVKTFKGLEHRLEYVGKYKEIQFYNDSIATAQEAVINAIKSLKDVNTIIVGGMDRGLNYEKLVKYLIESSVENIILLPDTNNRIKNLFDSIGHYKNNIYIVENMDKAVKMSYEVTKKNKICLLSPAAASYGFYLNFEKRGEHFKDLVKEYANK